MYNPSRGGVRGGADQFTWESVKTDKHRENYLGHSLKAPVGRWQKGKDLSWYAKERKDGDMSVKMKSELAAIKRAEEEAMLIALGHNIVQKESQSLTKEEMKEALRRNVGERDEFNIERVDGVGATSRRAAMMSGISKTTKGEGVTFESYAGKEADARERKEASNDLSSAVKRKKSKKSSKKHKKEKKKHRRHSSDSEEEVTRHSKHRRSSKYDDSVDTQKEKCGRRRRHDSSSSHSENDQSLLHRTHSQSKHKSGSTHNFPQRRRHDSSDSD